MCCPQLSTSYLWNQNRCFRAAQGEDPAANVLTEVVARRQWCVVYLNICHTYYYILITTLTTVTNCSDFTIISHGTLPSKLVASKWKEFLINSLLKIHMSYWPSSHHLEPKTATVNYSSASDKHILHIPVLLPRPSITRIVGDARHRPLLMILPSQGRAAFKHNFTTQLNLLAFASKFCPPTTQWFSVEIRRLSLIKHLLFSTLLKYYPIFSPGRGQIWWKLKTIFNISEKCDLFSLRIRGVPTWNCSCQGVM